MDILKSILCIKIAALNEHEQKPYSDVTIGILLFNDSVQYLNNISGYI